MGSMSHNTSGNTDGMARFEDVVDQMLARSVENAEQLFDINPAHNKKRKYGAEVESAKKGLYRFFVKALEERKLLSTWLEKKVVSKCRWRLDEIDEIMNRDEGPAVVKAEKALEDLLKELSTALYSDLF